ncbi:SMI1/KNR4 family protein [Actinoplanes sp. Pm04-4]|uniref:SMI1/KNR4 family protein n=1 Tax=Paractinoplanes pyxinae TaxID=2997416 RepID=A0ABT4BEQ8_9ACTN|nr:SMI1/KNR4 family protein [Actinoplanes pyxinae]MCY1144060.1 SMI1/KNR4 family protein [Actinoplanes pyxinae]
MTVGYRRQPPAAPGADIERLEQRIASRLPRMYRDYLAGQDGGRLESNTRAAKEVFGVRDDAPDWANMWDMLDTYDGRVPSWLQPVAQDEYGNLFAISLRAQDEGSVWFWDHEEEADGASRRRTTSNASRTTGNSSCSSCSPSEHAPR